MRRGIYLLAVLVLCTAFCGYSKSVTEDNYVRTWVYLDSTGNDSRARISTVYYDGLGRERLTVSGTPQIEDSYVAVKTDYNTRGLRERTWLPVPGGVECLNTKSHSARIKAFYADELPCSRVEYENNARGRVAREYGPGKFWERKGIKNNWHTCSASGEYSCRKVLVNKDGEIYVDGVYAPGTLRVTDVEDADGRRVLTFENRSGKVVAERRIKEGVQSETRYVYDVYGDLRFTLPPAATEHLPATSGTLDSGITEKYAQSFTYDSRHRCITYRLPGCAATEYVYDKYGNLIFSADGIQRTKDEWTATLYDNKLRPALRGTVKLSGMTAAQLRQTYADSTLTPGNDVSIAEFMVYTAPSSLPGFTPVMAWYYDNYDFMATTNTGQKAMFESSEYPATGLLTGTAVIAESTEPIFTAMRYDPRGNVDLMGKWDCYLQDFRLLVESDYDFTGQIMSRTETTQSVSEATVLKENKARFTYTYDAMGRLTSEQLAVNDLAPQTIHTCEYDAIGRLIREWRGVDVEYGYDVRSNRVSTSSPVYSQQVAYAVDAATGAETPSYTMVNSTTDTWHATDSGLAPYTLTLGYTYGPMGNLSRAADTSGSISENLEVDADANVVAVKRNYRNSCIQDAVLDMDGELPTAIRDVSAPYYQDAVGRFAPGDYGLTHDILGRLTSDASRQVKSISYYPWANMPKIISMQNGDNIVNTYQSDGALLKRKLTTKYIVTTTRVDANGDTIVKNINRYKSVYHTYLGSFDYDGYYSGFRIVTPVGLYDSKAKKHYWNITNHQGSVMAVVDSDGKVAQRSGLYPSGTPFTLPVDFAADSVTMRAGAIDERLHIGNRWLSHSGLNWYDNTARMHDPLLCRFTTPDPLATDYTSSSPWTHCLANPANILDPTGCANFYMNKNDALINVGSDGKNDERSFVVKNSLGKKIQKLTAKGRFYEGEIGNNKMMAEITNITEFDVIEQAVKDANNDGFERGMSKDKDGVVHVWDKGSEVKEDKGKKVHSVMPFRKNGKHIPYRSQSLWYMHIHPINKADSQFGSSDPSYSDKKYDKSMRTHNYTGTTFLIGGKDGRITFYYETKKIMDIPFDQLKNLHNKN